MNKRLLTVIVLGMLCLATSARVKPGIEVLRERGFSGLEGRRVGLVTNPSGVDSQLRSTIEILWAAPEVNLVALFGPEHGVRGDVWAGGTVAGSTDPLTGLPVHSLYGATREPTAAMLEGIDVMVYDIQDVGTRSYTFISTLGLVMRACAARGIEVMVLDRPDPLGGTKVEGPYPEEGWYSFVGQYRIPYIYGMTVGELARLINEEGLNCGQKGNLPHARCRLTVIPMEGWQRGMDYAATGLPWVAPSPNIPYPQNAVCYPCAGLVGEFNDFLNIGIGYSMPFGTFASEWIDADVLKAELDSYELPGIAWRTIHYTPFAGSMKGKLLHGVQYYFTDFAAAELTTVQFYVMQAVFKRFGVNPFKTPGLNLSMFHKVTGSEKTAALLGSRLVVEDVLPYWHRDEAAFRLIRENYLIYK